MDDNECDRFGLHMANGRFDRQKDSKGWNRLFSICSKLYTHVIKWNAEQPPPIRAFSDPIKATLYSFDTTPMDSESNLIEDDMLVDWLASVMSRRSGYLAVADFLDHKTFEITGGNHELFRDR